MPYFLVGDDAFALTTWMMKPYSTKQLSLQERIFNYRLSRARRIVENAFGLLTNRFRVLQTTIDMEPETVTSLVMACVCLHNFHRIRNPRVPNVALAHHGPDPQLVPGAWRQANILQEVQAVKGPTREAKAAKQQRVYLKHYLNNIGAVPWQRDMV
jgi:hypothetical protein